MLDARGGPYLAMDDCQVLLFFHLQLTVEGIFGQAFEFVFGTGRFTRATGTGKDFHLNGS